MHCCLKCRLSLEQWCRGALDPSTPEDTWEDMGEASKEEYGSYSQRTLVGIH